ncbi:MAG TPA: hypothetical protein PK916_17600 [Bacteroidota bacterium]|nr:hypothetical protein [Bacteroidota bacterium]
MMLPRLHTLPRALRALLTAFLLSAAVGFGMGVLFVEHSTRLSVDGIAERYRGSEAMGVDIEALPPGREIQYDKSEAEILNITHAHILSLSLLFLAVGAIFALSEGLPGWLRSFVLIEPFVSIVLTFGGMWFVRFHHPAWSMLMAVSGIAMTFSYAVMTFWSIRCLWRTRRD